MGKVTIHCATVPKDYLRVRRCGEVLEVVAQDGGGGGFIDLDLAGAKKLVKAAQTWIDEQEGGQ